MRKENVFIDLSKCSEEEQKHIFSLLPKDEITAQIYYMIRNMDWGVLESFNHLFFNEKNVWQICSNHSTETISKTELFYSNFIKLFDGGVEYNANIFEKELFALVNSHVNKGLSKPDLIRKMEWVLVSCKMS